MADLPIWKVMEILVKEQNRAKLNSEVEDDGVHTLVGGTRHEG